MTHEVKFNQKGDRARAMLSRASGLPDGICEAADDLAWLADHGALGGVAEILRERRRQVEALRHTPEADDRNGEDGWMATRARFELGRMLHSRVNGTADPATDEESLRKAGALCAAEMTRLQRMVSQ